MFNPVSPVPVRLGVLVATASILTCTSASWAQDRAEFDQLQATTQVLIDTLVESGVLSRDKAEQLMAKARARGLALTQAQAQVGGRLASGNPQTVADTNEIGKDGKRVVRVPYVPEAVKREMRDQIKQEVIAQARTERWGQADAYPSWLNNFKLEGDFRFREEGIRLSRANTAPGLLGANYTTAGGFATRAADIAQGVGNGISNFNTQSNFDRMRIRARLGVTGQLTDAVSASLRLATGNLTDRTSTNQTLGQSFNKYTVVFDQAYLKVKPWGEQLAVSAGRMPNPFFSTDLVWADDLGFEGIAASLNQELFGKTKGYVNAGYFPLTENRPGTTRARNLLGLQGGLDMGLGASPNRLKLGVGLYNYRGIEGKREDLAAQFGEPMYATRYEYASGFRQRGNTLFNVRAPTDLSTPVYGLASAFRELNLTATLDVADLLPVPLRITGDYVKNLGFNRAEIAGRTGLLFNDGKDYGFMARLQVGAAQISKRGQWNASVAYRYLGSDAVLDAFTNSDFGMGGTNNQGLVLGVNYGIYDGTWLALRWISSNAIDSYAPGSAVATKLSVDTVQLELNTRF